VNVRGEGLAGSLFGLLLRPLCLQRLFGLDGDPKHGEELRKPLESQASLLKVALQGFLERALIEHGGLRFQVIDQPDVAAFLGESVQRSCPFGRVTNAVLRETLPNRCTVACVAHIHFALQCMQRYATVCNE
jgi:hypothetical protein